MDKLDRYREIIRTIVAEYASWFPHDDDIQTEVVIDGENDHFEILRVGWEEERRVHYASIHLDIINGKIWIQEDRTNRPVADALLKAGVPREDIVLGFHPASMRQYTDFAVA